MPIFLVMFLITAYLQVNWCLVSVVVVVEPRGVVNLDDEVCVAMEIDGEDERLFGGGDVCSASGVESSGGAATSGHSIQSKIK
jgi:hypothetical protein